MMTKFLLFEVCFSFFVCLAFRPIGISPIVTPTVNFLVLKALLPKIKLNFILVFFTNWSLIPKNYAGMVYFSNIFFPNFLSCGVLLSPQGTEFFSLNSCFGALLKKFACTSTLAFSYMTFAMESFSVLDRSTIFES